MGNELEPTMSLSPAVTLDAYGVHTSVESLRSLKDTAARILVARIRKEWRYRRSGQDYITIRLTNNELELMKQVGSNTRPSLVSYKYVAVYRHPEADHSITVRSIDRPPKKRSFKIPNRGRKRFRRVKLFRIKQPKESVVAKAKTKKKKAVEEDELEGLEELEEIEADEPDDDEDVDDEDSEDEEDDDEEDDEEEEAPPKRQRKSSKKGKKQAKKDTKKSKSKKSKQDEDEDDEDEDEAPKKSKKGKKDKKGKGKSKGSKDTKSPGRSTKELTGGVGTAELAEAASELAESEITGRDVRVYLRKNKVGKNEEHGRYVWPSTSNKEFKKLAKAVAAEYEDED